MHSDKSKGFHNPSAGKSISPRAERIPWGCAPRQGSPLTAPLLLVTTPRAGSQGRFFIRSARGARLGAQPSLLPADPAIFFKVSTLQTLGAAWGGSETDSPLLSAPFYLWSY